MMEIKVMFVCACLAVTLLDNAASRVRLEKTVNREDRSLIQTIPIEAFFDDELQELTLKFWDDGYPILIEVKDEVGNIIFVNSYPVNSGNIFQIPLKGIPSGKYTLFVSDEKEFLMGDFYY